MIVGIDEVGRGPWAGPLLVGAVVLGDAAIEGLTDSKKLTKKKREILSAEIYEKAASIGLGWVSAEELDKIGMSAALALGCRRALEKITVPYHQIIIDGTVNLLKDTGKGAYVTTMKKADLLVPSVSAASIVAKVARDTYMEQQATLYPQYGFEKHAGYGTKYHSDALGEYGVTPLHRISFAPIAALLGNVVEKEKSPVKSPMINTGQKAETVAAEYLEKHGYTVLQRNWKTKACEIDIVAEKSSVVHFVEVKYRKSRTQGGGIAAITPTKLKQMKRAATIWLQRYGERDAQLSAIEVSGDDFMTTLFLEQVPL